LDELTAAYRKSEVFQEDDEDDYDSEEEGETG
jgi:hypothetical protein